MNLNPAPLKISDGKSLNSSIICKLKKKKTENNLHQNLRRYYIELSLFQKLLYIQILNILISSHFLVRRFRSLVRFGPWRCPLFGHTIH